MTAPRLLALDLSLSATGIAWSRDDAGHTLLGCTTIMTDQLAGDPARRRVILRRIAEKCQDLPDLVVIERLPAYQHGDTTIRLAKLHGVVEDWLHVMGIPWVLVSPSTLQVYATGRGRADKRQVLAAMQTRHAVYVADDNAADALAMLALASHAYGHPLAAVPDTHSRAVLSVRWPTLERPPAGATAISAGRGAPERTR